MRTMKLGEILTDAQIERTLDIIQSTTRHDRIAKLKEYFSSFKDELEKKGVLPDYLAYVVEYLLANQIKKVETYERN
jgi:uncharacterized membrane protein